MKFDSIASAIEAIKNGKIQLVTGVVEVAVSPISRDKIKNILSSLKETLYVGLGTVLCHIWVFPFQL